MAQSEILTLAKQGNPKAIAALMNYSLRSKQITVVVDIADACLSVVATAPKPPDRAFMIHFVRKGLDKLGIESLDRAIVEGYGTDRSRRAWQETLMLEDATTSNPFVGQIPLLNSLPAPLPSSPPTPPPVTPTLTPDRGLNRETTSPARKKATSGKRKTSKPLHPVLRWMKTTIGALLYIVCVAVTFGLAVPIKVFTALLSENALYQLPIAGDMFRGLEVAELFNVLVFAVFGTGLGIATALVPKAFGHRMSAALLIVALPVIFVLGSFVRYEDWVRDFAANEQITHEIAIETTDTYLSSQVGRGGFPGFYFYTARYPILPVDASEMKEVKALEERTVARINRVVEIEPENLSRLFSISIWGVRIFYFGLSIVTAIAHFSQGEELADKLAKRGNFRKGKESRI
ncbi:hypothetical protein IQ235_04655 [Oscillatoriales cyanobacterium LEGE 11467]|uniref:Uncharacterized protein n=1 Tax=Zarconia navalis LEGE 11467 TaxID=1828826 RepID=A0A928VWM0_9CYAN|nr:hypothetical protein [Zarconia navalis]MBE9040082.1 hypothetical protein [Zarconia navalis LEGE 11467]